MVKKYRINPLAVLFHSAIDRLNNYHTIIYNPKKDKIFEINSSSYRILKIIDKKPGIIFKQLLVELKKTSYGGKLKNFIEKMIGESIILENESQ